AADRVAERSEGDRRSAASLALRRRPNAPRGRARVGPSGRTMIDIPTSGVSIARVKLSRQLSIAGKVLFAFAISLSYVGGGFGHAHPVAAIAPALGALTNFAGIVTMVVSYILWTTRSQAPGRVTFDG